MLICISASSRCRMLPRNDLDEMEILRPPNGQLANYLAQDFARYFVQASRVDEGRSPVFGGQ